MSRSLNRDEQNAQVNQLLDDEEGPQDDFTSVNGAPKRVKKVDSSAHIVKRMVIQN